MSTLHDAIWQAEQLPELLALVADRFVGSRHRGERLRFRVGDDPRIWIPWAAGHYGLEANSVVGEVAAHEDMIDQPAPVLIPLQRDSERDPWGYLFLLRTKKGVARLLAPDRQTVQVSTGEVKDLHCAQVMDSFDSEIEEQISFYESLVDLGKVRNLLLNARAANYPTPPHWVFRSALSSSIMQNLREAGILRALAALTFGQMLTIGANLAVWVVLGFLVTSPASSIYWLAGWGIVLALKLVFESWSNYLAQRLTLYVSTLLKRAMMRGAVTMDDEVVRGEGSGHGLTRTFETDSISTVISMLSIDMASTAISILYVFFAFQFGAQSFLMSLMYLVALGATAWMGKRFFEVSRHRITRKMDQTHRLVEIMSGFRTISIQGKPWSHRSEDWSLNRYLHTSTKADRISIHLELWPAYGWLVFSLALALFVSFQSDMELFEVGLTIGGAIFGYFTLQGVVGTLAQAIPALAAWPAVAPMLRASRQEPDLGEVLAGSKDAVRGDRPVLSLRNCSYQYVPGGKAVIDNVTWHVQHGDRILLVGDSGGGKSTLASILAGARHPTRGLMFLGGHDARTLGADAHRELVALATQFHENVILQGSLLYNLCIGRRWPAVPRDEALAEEICRELGLGDLLDTMPSGIQQMVGDGGWTLSHGERSRVFLARTLLQDTPLLILDESFAALDPSSILQCMDAVQKRADTLIVIAHP